jgi:hypothetical protein
MTFAFNRLQGILVIFRIGCCPLAAIVRVRKGVWKGRCMKENCCRAGEVFMGSRGSCTDSAKHPSSGSPELSPKRGSLITQHPPTSFGRIFALYRHQSPAIPTCGRSWSRSGTLQAHYPHYLNRKQINHPRPVSLMASFAINHHSTLAPTSVPHITSLSPAGTKCRTLMTPQVSS